MDGALGHYPSRCRLQRLLYASLRTERSCSADVLTERWLTDRLAAWNKALRTTKLGLGKFSLRPDNDGDVYVAVYRSAGNENDGALFLAWLPGQHQCIREVRVHERTRFNRFSFMSSVIVGPASSLHSVVFHPRCRIQPENEFLQAFRPPKCLCDLDFTNVRTSDALAPQVA